MLYDRKFEVNLEMPSLREMASFGSTIERLNKTK